MRYAVAILAVIVAMTALASAQFVCQQTIDIYNANVNTGNFGNAADLTFDPNVVYIVPGAEPACPYCNTYYGKTAVKNLFIQGFLGHFTIWNPLVNLRQLYTNNTGPGGVPRLMDFNDEAFRINPEFNGRYFRVGVIHDFLFNPTTCLITQMHLYHDPYVASMAFAGYPAVAVPIMPGLSQNPPYSGFSVPTTVGLYNWQYITNENLVTPAQAWTLINDYYAKLMTGSVSGIDAFFMDNDNTIAQGYAAVLVPGDSQVLPFANLYTGRAQIQNYHTLLQQTLQTNNLPTLGAINVTSGGSVAVFYTWNGVAQINSNWFSVDAVDYFQLTISNGAPKIARLTRFFDTWNVTMACTNYLAFPQFSSDLVLSVNTMLPLVKALIAIASAAAVLVAFVLVAVCRNSNNNVATPGVYRARDRDRGVSMVSVQSTNA